MHVVHTYGMYIWYLTYIRYVHWILYRDGASNAYRTFLWYAYPISYIHTVCRTHIGYIYCRLNMNTYRASYTCRTHLRYIYRILYTHTVCRTHVGYLQYVERISYEVHLEYSTCPFQAIWQHLFFTDSSLNPWIWQMWKENNLWG